MRAEVNDVRFFFYFRIFRCYISKKDDDKKIKEAEFEQSHRQRLAASSSNLPDYSDYSSCSSLNKNVSLLLFYYFLFRAIGSL